MPETRHSLVERMIGAMFLNIDVFEEVEHDRNATGQAATVVLMVAVASGIGASGTRYRKRQDTIHDYIGNRCGWLHGMDPTSANTQRSSLTPF